MPLVFCNEHVFNFFTYFLDLLFHCASNQQHSIAYIADGKKKKTC